MFENPAIVDTFLNFWRSTGNQRVGIMYGKYEPHKDTPLAIKATVAAIYEPPQVFNHRNWLSHSPAILTKEKPTFSMWIEWILPIIFYKFFLETRLRHVQS